MSKLPKTSKVNFLRSKMDQKLNFLCSFPKFFMFFMFFTQEHFSYHFLVQISSNSIFQHNPINFCPTYPNLIIWSKTRSLLSMFSLVILCDVFCHSSVIFLCSPPKITTKICQTSGVWISHNQGWWCEILSSST